MRKSKDLLDRVPVSVSEWLLGSFVLILSICPTQPIFTNTESAMLSREPSNQNRADLNYCRGLSVPRLALCTFPGAKQRETNLKKGETILKDVSSFQDSKFPKFRSDHLSAVIEVWVEAHRPVPSCSERNL